MTGATTPLPEIEALRRLVGEPAAWRYERIDAEYGTPLIRIRPNRCEPGAEGRVNPAWSEDRLYDETAVLTALATAVERAEKAEAQVTAMDREAKETEREEHRLRMALAFYANPKVYEPHPHGPAFERRDLSFHAKSALAGKFPVDALATERAARERLEAALRRAIDEAVADDMDDWYAAARAALASSATEGEVHD